MIDFEIVATKEVTINGVGLLRAGEPRILSAEELAHFEAEHGYPIGKANFPNYVSLAAVVPTKTNNKRNSEEV